jgi:type IV secretory pathway VirB2 component (pilin)
MSELRRPALFAVAVVIVGASMGIFAALGSPGWGVALLVVAEIVLAIVVARMLQRGAPR